MKTGIEMEKRGITTKYLNSNESEKEPSFWDKMLDDIDNYRNPFLPPDQNEYAQKNGINLSGINFSGINLKGVQLDHNVNGLLEKPVNLPNNGKNVIEIG